MDGRIVTSDTNTMTTAIDGVTLSLLDLSTAASTLTVGVNTDAVKKALTDLVTSYNALADTLDKLTANVPGGTGGALRGDATVMSLAVSLRSLIMNPGPGLSGAFVSLGDLGVNSGAIGAKAGSTTRLSLDAEKLSAALANNPTRVAYLLSSSGGIMGPLQSRIKALTQSGGLVDGRQVGDGRRAAHEHADTGPGPGPDRPQAGRTGSEVRRPRGHARPAPVAVVAGRRAGEPPSTRAADAKPGSVAGAGVNERRPDPAGRRARPASGDARPARPASGEA